MTKTLLLKMKTSIGVKLIKN